MTTTPLSAFLDKNGKLVATTAGGHSVVYFDNEDEGSNVYCPDCANKPENITLIDGYTVLYDGETDVCDNCGQEIR